MYILPLFWFVLYDEISGRNEKLIKEILLQVTDYIFSILIQSCCKPPSQVFNLISILIERFGLDVLIGKAHLS